MLQRGLLPYFSAEAIAELARIEAPAIADHGSFRDLRHLTWASIDNDDSLDLDQFTVVFTAVFNGVAAVPLIYIIARINSSKKILGKNRGGILSRSLVWLTFAVMAIAAIAMFYTLARPH